MWLVIIVAMVIVAMVMVVVHVSGDRDSSSRGTNTSHFTSEALLALKTGLNRHTIQHTVNIQTLGKHSSKIKFNSSDIDC